jgi:hypothetical protein
MTLFEKRLSVVNVVLTPGETLQAFDPVILENVGGKFHIRKANYVTETPHAILNSDCTLVEGQGEILVPSWWLKALKARYNAEHDHA